MNFSRNNYFIILVLSKIEHNKIIQNGCSKMADVSSSFFVINDVIMTSLLLLKIVCVSQLLDTLSVYFEGNLDSDYKFNDMTS